MGMGMGMGRRLGEGSAGPRSRAGSQTPTLPGKPPPALRRTPGHPHASKRSAKRTPTCAHTHTRASTDTLAHGHARTHGHTDIHAQPCHGHAHTCPAIQLSRDSHKAWSWRWASVEQACGLGNEGAAQRGSNKRGPCPLPVTPVYKHHRIAGLELQASMMGMAIGVRKRRGLPWECV